MLLVALLLVRACVVEIVVASSRRNSSSCSCRHLSCNSSASGHTSSHQHGGMLMGYLLVGPVRITERNYNSRTIQIRIPACAQDPVIKVDPKKDGLGAGLRLRVQSYVITVLLCIIYESAWVSYIGVRISQ